jgi:hypothetical protein
MFTKQIRQILAIIALVLFVGPVFLIIIHILSPHILNHSQSHYRDSLNSWQTQPHVMAASVRYHLMSWILGIIGSIVLVKVGTILFDRLSRFNRRYVILGGFFVSSVLSVLLCSHI